MPEKTQLSEAELESRLQSIEDHLNFLSTDEKSKNALEIMDIIILKRNEARAAKDWAVADKIRNLLDKINIVLKDNKEGTVWEEKN